MNYYSVNIVLNWMSLWELNVAFPMHRNTAVIKCNNKWKWESGVKWVSTPELEEMRGTHDRIVLGENCSWQLSIIPRLVSMTPFIHLLIYFLHSQIKHRFAWLEFGDLRVVVMKQKHEIRQWSRCHVKTVASVQKLTLPAESFFIHSLSHKRIWHDRDRVSYQL